ncbi:MAG: TIGR00266 family protein [Armatimonadetes bacterium]|nr:TIGR00266 family protein [Armatimonadota bacterium]
MIGHTAFQSLRVLLDPGETFVSEAGKMVRMSGNVDLDVTTANKGGGGLLGGLKRMLGGETFFFSTYRVIDGRPGEVVLAPTLPGNVGLLQLDGTSGWYCTGGSYLASSSSIRTEAKWQGIKGLLSGENMVFIHCTGQGPVATDAYGVVYQELVNGSFTVDTGHVVAFEDTLQYEISKVGGSWWTSWLAGEGFVLNFRGQGRVVCQSHNRNAFGKILGPMLPERGA